MNTSNSLRYWVADITACSEDTTARVADITARSEDTTACSEDTTARVVDITARSEDTTARVADITACSEDTTAWVANITACSVNTTAWVADITACSEDTTAWVADITACSKDATARLVNDFHYYAIIFFTKKNNFYCFLQHNLYIWLNVKQQKTYHFYSSCNYSFFCWHNNYNYYYNPLGVIFLHIISVYIYFFKRLENR
ncbi:hypothetical protein [Bizionia sp.]|uniref:hypothetical protein n=1 Tax=Bizionia sp. TaxID=1954480 RepID=UPI003A933025